MRLLFLSAECLPATTNPKRQQQRRPHEQSLRADTSEASAASSAGDRALTPQAAGRRPSLPRGPRGPTVAARYPQTPEASLSAVASASSPKRVTTELLGCLTVPQLHACLSRHREAANGISVAAALTRLAKLVDGRGGGNSSHRDRFASGSAPGSIDPGAATKTEADVARQVPSSSHHDSDDAEALLELATDLLQRHLPSLTTRGYANALWACSKCFAADTRPARDGGGGLRSAAAACAGDLADAMLMPVPPPPPPHLAHPNSRGAGFFASYSKGGITSAVNGGDSALFGGANAQDVANACYGLATIGLDDHAVWEEVLLPRALQV